ncbi:MAG: peptidase dimerization domain-containing protein, partial [Myxococcota bacterium]
TEKSPCWLRVVSRGRPGHSSVPPRDAAVPRLLAALARVQKLETPVRVVPPVAAMFAAMAPLAPEDDREGFANLADGLENDPAFRNRFLSDRHYAAMVRNTLTTTVLQGSSRTNMIPTIASAHLDARLLPDESCSAFADQVRSLLADPGIGVEILLHFESELSPTDTPLYRAIERVAAVEDPGARVVPGMNAGFTRGHRAGEERGVHGPDERVSVENLERGIDALIAILLELDRVEAGWNPLPEVSDRPMQGVE